MAKKKALWRNKYQREVTQDIVDFAVELSHDRIHTTWINKGRYWYIDWGNDFEFENHMCQRYGDQTRIMDEVVRVAKTLIKAQSTRSQSLRSGLWEQAENTSYWLARRLELIPNGREYDSV